MAAIVILEHELQRYVEQPYMVYSLAERWRRAGHAVLVHRGLGTPPPGDLAIANIDLTVIPGDYRALYARYPRVVNGGVTDVSKSRFSADLLDRYSDWIGPVIVKTEANYGGKPEQLLRALREPLVLLDQADRLARGIEGLAGHPLVRREEPDRDAGSIHGDRHEMANGILADRSYRLRSDRRWSVARGDGLGADERMKVAVLTCFQPMRVVVVLRAGPAVANVIPGIVLVLAERALMRQDLRDGVRLGFSE